jgi:hypothetical protein
MQGACQAEAENIGSLSILPRPLAATKWEAGAPSDDDSESIKLATI